jgi:ribosome-binding protein aMBF1 (putative translation factor)
MSESKRISRAEMQRRRLFPENMTAEQRAAYEQRKAARETPEYQAQLRQDIEEIQREHPPLRTDDDLLDAMASLRRERERQGLSLTDMTERTGMDRATISKLETGKILNPTYQTIRNYARALGKRVVWQLEDAASSASEKTVLRPVEPATDEDGSALS